MIAYFAGVSIKKTTDGGASIPTGTAGDVTAPHVDNHALAFTAGGDLIVGQDGGVARTSNGGLMWTRVNQGLGVNQLYAGITIHPTDAEYVLGGFQDNGSNTRNATGA